MRSDVSALGAVTNALNLGSSVLNTATSAMNSVEDILKRMKADLVTAQTAGTDKVQVQSDITAQQQSLVSIMNSASFNGVNMLDGSTATTNIVDSFSRNGAGTTTTGTLTVSTSGVALGGSGSAGGLLGTTLSLAASSQGTASTGSGAGQYAKDSLLAFTLTSTTTTTDLSTIATAIDKAITAVTAGAATLGQYSTTVANQLSYTSSLSDAIKSGVGSLVDADMNVASTRLQALQTQQQLGIQALAIANQNSQLILKLFNG
jgi:flagellin